MLNRSHLEAALQSDGASQADQLLDERFLRSK